MVSKNGDVDMTNGNQPWRIESRKYDGSLHRVWESSYPLYSVTPNRDEYAPDFMLKIPANAKVIEADGKEWGSAYDVIACFYAHRHYQVMVLRKGRMNEFYCNICTIAEIESEKRLVKFIDLDLDLLIDKTRTLRVVDQDEFEANSLLYGYPEELMMRAQADLAELMRQARRQKGVFSVHFRFPGEDHPIGKVDK